jgi:hypothetical protein
MVQGSVLQQASCPQMYMHALLGPAVVGRQMPLVHVTYDLMPEVRLKSSLVLPMVRCLNTDIRIVKGG